MKKCSTHADLFVRLFARAITSKVPPTLSVKISTVRHNFFIDYCRDFSHILHIWTRPQVNFSVTSIMSKITCNLKTIAFREFRINILFSYFVVSYNIVIFQTCSLLHSQVIATLRLSLLSKSVRI